MMRHASDKSPPATTTVFLEPVSNVSGAYCGVARKKKIEKTQKSQKTFDINMICSSRAHPPALWHRSPIPASVLRETRVRLLRHSKQGLNSLIPCCIVFSARDTLLEPLSSMLATNR